MARAMAEKIIRFFTIDIWRLSGEDLPKPHAALLTPLCVIVMTVKGYVHDNCAL